MFQENLGKFVDNTIFLVYQIKEKGDNGWEQKHNRCRDTPLSISACFHGDDTQYESFTDMLDD